MHYKTSSNFNFLIENYSNTLSILIWEHWHLIKREKLPVRHAITLGSDP